MDVQGEALDMGLQGFNNPEYVTLHGAGLPAQDVDQGLDGPGPVHIDGDGVDGGEHEGDDLLELTLRADLQHFLGQVVSELVDHKFLEDCDEFLDEHSMEVGVLGLVESLLEHPAPCLVVGVEVECLQDLLVFLGELVEGEGLLLFGGAGEVVVFGQEGIQSLFSVPLS
ncbi:MAG: hypothetical protein ACMG6E_06175 [Candidatus Roizmanbacteria bacterium]